MADSTGFTFGPASAWTSLAASSTGDGWTIVEVELGDEEPGQTRVQVVADPEGMPAGVRVDGDEGELFGEQHGRDANNAGRPPGRHRTGAGFWVTAGSRSQNRRARHVSTNLVASPSSIVR